MIAKATKRDSRSVQPEVNHILQTLPAEEYKRLLPQLQPVALVQDQVLFDVGARIAGGYFVKTGLVSCLTVMKNGDSVEVGLLGHEGFAGLPILLNIVHSSTRITVQIAGDAMRINAEALHNLLPELPMLERLLSRFTYLQALQAQQIAACNRLHDIAGRLARWLLMTQDRVRLPILPLTQGLMADMLGTRRSSVTVAAGILQKAGIIDYRRGQVHILDRQRLEEAACECYPAVRTQLHSYLNTGLLPRPEI
jgi:CRP-like cAMP-binding protein